MTTEIIIQPQDQAFLDAIENVSSYWHEIGLPDHPIYPQFSRKIVVTGFNSPELASPEERIYVNVSQVLTLKATSQIHKVIQMPLWMIHELNKEEVLNAQGEKLEGIKVYKREDGTEIKRETFFLTTNSVKLVKFMLMGRIAYLPDILNKFMAIYVEKFKTEIDAI